MTIPSQENIFPSVETLYLVSVRQIKRKSRLQTFYGSENYSSKKSVLERVRWFESIPAHQKVEILTDFSFFYFYSKLLVSIDVTLFQSLSLFKLYLKLFAIFCCFFTSARKLHGRNARKNILCNSTVSVDTQIQLV